jgi:hypothetical protein
MAQHGPLMMFSAVLLLAGLNMLAVGLLGEMQVRHYHEPAQRAPYPSIACCGRRAKRARSRSESQRSEVRGQIAEVKDPKPATGQLEILLLQSDL